MSGILMMGIVVETPVKVAAFDLDDTLVIRVKGRGDSRWEPTDPRIPELLGELIEKGYIIVVFTNQSGLEKASIAVKDSWKKRFENFFSRILRKYKGYYLSVYVATGNDSYRKPNVGLWNLLKIDLAYHFLGRVSISKKSFYCGDAAGRTKPSPLKKLIHPTSRAGDFADTDYKFAINIGVRFQTPEDFLGMDDPTERVLKGFDPETFLEGMTDRRREFRPRSKELIVMVGRPGSGKSLYVQQYIEPEGYIVVNQDTCKTQAKCLALLRSALNDGESVVIDNTDPDVASRKVWIKEAQKAGYRRIRAIVMETSPELAEHLDNVRHLYSKGKRDKIHRIAYNVFNKKYVEPTKEEGFDRVVKLPFVMDPQQLEDKKWMSYFMLRT